MKNLSRADIIAFWQEIAENSVLIKSFLIGDGKVLKQRIADAQQSKIEYPFLDCDLIEASTKADVKVNTVDLFIGAAIPADDYQQIDDMLVALERHIDAIALYISAVPNAKKPFSKIEFTKVIEDRQSYVADGIVGYYINCTMHYAINCAYQKHFIDITPEKTTAQFEWQINELGNIEFIDCSMGTDESQNQWFYKEDKASQTSPILFTGDLAKPTNNFYVELHTKNAAGKVFKARMYLHKNDNSLSGVSYSINSTKNIY